LASEDGILYLYAVLATNLGLSICNKIPEPKRYALWFVDGKVGEGFAPGSGYATTSKALCRGHNTCSYKLADGGELLRVVLRSAKQL
jgi:hypothetical protein